MLSLRCTPLCVPSVNDALKRIPNSMASLGYITQLSGYRARQLRIPRFGWTTRTRRSGGSAGRFHPDAARRGSLRVDVRAQGGRASQIEGTQSSLQDVLNAEARILGPDRPQDAYEVINYVGAMNHGLARLKELPLSIRLIREIHGLLLAGGRGSHLQPGELRRSQNWIGPPCALRDAFFVPPPPGEVVEFMGDLEKFLHDPGELPALIWIGWLTRSSRPFIPFWTGTAAWVGSSSRSCSVSGRSC